MMNGRDAWYEVKLFRSNRSAITAVAYKTMYDKISEVFKHHGVISSSKVHSGRKEAAQTLDRGGVSLTDIARFGRWQQGTCVTVCVAFV